MAPCAQMKTPVYLTCLQVLTLHWSELKKPGNWHSYLQPRILTVKIGEVNSRLDTHEGRTRDRCCVLCILCVAASAVCCIQTHARI